MSEHIEHAAEPEMITETRLTTFDNPHSPFDDFKAWLAFDTRSGYNTTGLLARITTTSFEISSTDQRLANEDAIEEALRENVHGMFRKVTRQVPNPYPSAS